MLQGPIEKNLAVPIPLNTKIKDLLQQHFLTDTQKCEGSLKLEMAKYVLSSITR